jgi:hypothetical protein
MIYRGIENMAIGFTALDAADVTWKTATFAVEWQSFYDNGKWSGGSCVATEEKNDEQKRRNKRKQLVKKLCRKQQMVKTKSRRKLQ